MTFTSVTTAPRLRQAFEKIDDERRDLRPGILLQEMPTGEEVRAFRMRQQLFEAGGEGRMIEHVVLASPREKRGQFTCGELLSSQTKRSSARAS